MPEREPAVDDVAQVALAGLDRVVVRAFQDADGRVGDLVVAGLPGNVVRSRSIVQPGHDGTESADRSVSLEHVHWLNNSWLSR